MVHQAPHSLHSDMVFVLFLTVISANFIFSGVQEIANVWSKCKLFYFRNYFLGGLIRGRDEEDHKLKKL